MTNEFFSELSYFREGQVIYVTSGITRFTVCPYGETHQAVYYKGLLVSTEDTLSGHPDAFFTGFMTGMYHSQPILKPILYTEVELDGVFSNNLARGKVKWPKTIGEFPLSIHKEQWVERVEAFKL